jgi:hypothetical protein
LPLFLRFSQPCLAPLRRAAEEAEEAVVVVVEADDLLIRFSKIVFPDDASLYDLVLPLSPIDYPIRGVLADTLKRQSIAHSVITQDDFEVRNVSLSHYIQAIGGMPSFPSSNSSAEFWNEFTEVMDIRQDRLDGVNATDLMELPAIWSGYTLDQVADAVHDEYPASHHVELLKTFFGQGLELDYNILPFRSQRDFIGLEVRMADLLTWAFSVVVSA